MQGEAQAACASTPRPALLLPSEPIRAADEAPAADTAASNLCSTKNVNCRTYFLGGPGVKTLRFHCREHGFHLRLGSCDPTCMPHSRGEKGWGGGGIVPRMLLSTIHFVGQSTGAIDVPPRFAWAL